MGRKKLYFGVLVQDNETGNEECFYGLKYGDVPNEVAVQIEALSDSSDISEPFHKALAVFRKKMIGFGQGIVGVEGKKSKN